MAGKLPPQQLLQQLTASELAGFAASASANVFHALQAAFLTAINQYLHLSI